MKHLKLFEYKLANFNIDIKKLARTIEKGDPDVKRYTSKEILNYYKEFIKVYKPLIKNGKMKIYRNIYLSNSWFDDLFDNKIKRLGTSWSFALDSAVSWNSEYESWEYTDEELSGYDDFENDTEELSIDSGFEGKRSYYLVSTIKEEYIDWDLTFELFIVVPDETEIRLFKNTPIKLVKILDKKKNVKLSDITNNNLIA